MADRRWLYAQSVRQQLIDRGMPCPPLATDADTLRRQVREWVGLLEMRRPLVVRAAERLVLPEKPARARR